MTETEVKERKHGKLHAFVTGPAVNGSGKVIVMAASKYRSKWIEVCCIGNKRHYRKDGGCAHAENFIAQMKPEFRSRAVVVPFGDKPALEGRI